ncbi:MAG: LysR family transcriptional regulator [Raoultibacter sp.]
MRMDQIHHFLNVAQTHSITQAAMQLHISPQGLSRSIACLEKTCGIVLFTRTNLGMTLTDKGQQFAEIAGSLWEAYGEFEQSVAKLAQGAEQGEGASLELLASPIITISNFLPAILQELSEAFPSLRVDVFELNSFEMAEAALCLSAEQLDRSVMLATIPEYRMDSYLPEDRFVLHPLVEFSMAALMNKSHPLASRRYVTRAELAQEKLVCFNEPVIEEVIHHMLDEYGEPQFVFKGSTSSLIERFPDAISLSGNLSLAHRKEGAVCIPIQDSVKASIVAVTGRSTTALPRQVVGHIEHLFHESHCSEEPSHTS